MKPVRKRNKRTVMDYTKVGAFLDRCTGSICEYLLGKDNSPLMALKFTDEDAEKARENPGALGRGALGPRDKIHDRKNYLSATEQRESRDRLNKTLKTLLSRSKNGKHHLNGKR